MYNADWSRSLEVRSEHAASTDCASETALFIKGGLRISSNCEPIQTLQILLLYQGLTLEFSCFPSPGDAVRGREIKEIGRRCGKHRLCFWDGPLP